MEILEFNKMFSEIPEQDNPAFDVHECYMICKSPDGLRYSVLFIKPDEVDSVTRIAEFFDQDTALLWTDIYIDSMH